MGAGEGGGRGGRGAGRGGLSKANFSSIKTNSVKAHASMQHTQSPKSVLAIGKTNKQTKKIYSHVVLHVQCTMFNSMIH